MTLQILELNNAHSSVVKVAAKDHDRRKHDIVVLLLAILILSVMALVIVLQARNIFVTIVIGITTMFILIAIGKS